MICPECGTLVEQQLIQGEASLLVHRFLKHSSPEVQAVATILLSAAGAWVVGRLLSQRR